MLKKLWNDEVGALLSAEFVLLATILVLGAIVGLAAVRDAVVTELADVAQAIANVDQSYSYPGVDGHFSATGGCTFDDTVDFCDTTADPGNNSSTKCVNIILDSPSEGPDA